MSFTAIELCAGGGGQALGLELAGFHHEAVVEYEPQFCTTLRTNRPHWNVIQQDIRGLRPSDFTGIDLLAAGVPCPPFSIAGKQLGGDDERDMFPAALAIVEGARPRAVMFENVQGFASAKFADYRRTLLERLSKLGYQPEWRVLQAADYGVPQLRPRCILVALRARDAECFRWPVIQPKPLSAGETLVDLMGANGWRSAEAWVLERNGYTCQMCGMAAGDADPFSTSRTVRLTMGHIIDKSKGGKDTRENLRAVCTNCNEGLQNAALPKPDRIHLLAQVRRATIDDQQALLEWLLGKFGLVATKKV